MLRLVTFLLMVFSLAASPALSQSARQIPAQPADQMPVKSAEILDEPAEPIIHGPPAPVLPDVISRDDEGDATVRAIRLPAPLVFDGRLDEAFYGDVKSFGDFIQQDPFEGQPASERTEVWVFFDGTNVYVSARLWEKERNRRVANEMRRDSFNLYNNDHFAVLFDTFYDRRNGYSFYANSLGGMGDSQIVNEQPNPNWSAVWDARTAEFDGGWTIEMKFPFRSMRFKEGGELWGVNFRRLTRWNNESSFLTPIPRSYGRRGITKVSSGGTLVGIETPANLRNLDVKPYLLGSLATNRVASPPINNAVNRQFGVDAKWAITQSLVTDFTYNTDFAQVEDDEAQVNLTRFSLFFPEKREFFLEGQDYFSFGAGNFGGGGGGGGGGSPGGGGGGNNNPAPLVFYSRRIGLSNGLAVPILGGARLLGRAGGFQLGALQMRTEASDVALARETDFSVLRLNRNVLSRSRVGLIATRRAPGTAFGVADNYAYGADAAFNFKTDLSMTGYWSATDSPGTTDLDSSYRGAFNWNADRTGLQAEHLYVGDNFNPEVGLVRRRGFRRSYGQGRFSPRPKHMRGVRKLTFEGAIDYYETTARTVESREAQGTFRLELTTSDQLSVEYTDAFEHLAAPFTVAPGVTIPVGDYSFRQARGTAMLSASRRISGFVTVTSGEFYDGSILEASWRGRVEFSSRLSAEPSMTINHVETPHGKGANNVIGSRLTYTLTPRMFVGALVQFQSATRTATSNIRFRWEYQPGSELFVVYSDGRDTHDRNFPPPILNRSLVVKATKLFRF